MQLSRGEEMIGQILDQECANGEARYATREDFCRIFHEHLNGLYQLSFLLTADHRKAEECFVSGIENCAQVNCVFREWARVWAKRVIAENAIRALNPRPTGCSSSSRPTAFSHHQQSRGPIQAIDLNSVLRLADFDRFVLVLCVLEHYREHECALLLECSLSEVREARNRAIPELAGIGQVNPIERKTVRAVVGTLKVSRSKNESACT